jgi:hypothetical protein
MTLSDRLFLNGKKYVHIYKIISIKTRVRQASKKTKTRIKIFINKKVLEWGTADNDVF